jgi:hypothetical protein
MATMMNPPPDVGGHDSPTGSDATDRGAMMNTLAAAGCDPEALTDCSDEALAEMVKVLGPLARQDQQDDEMAKVQGLAASPAFAESAKAMSRDPLSIVAGFAEARKRNPRLTAEQFTGQANLSPYGPMSPKLADTYEAQKARLEVAKYSESYRRLGVDPGSIVEDFKRARRKDPTLTAKRFFGA